MTNLEALSILESAAETEGGFYVEYHCKSDYVPKKLIIVTPKDILHNLRINNGQIDVSLMQEFKIITPHAKKYREEQGIIALSNVHPPTARG